MMTTMMFQMLIAAAAAAAAVDSHPAHWHCPLQVNTAIKSQ